MAGKSGQNLRHQLRIRRLDDVVDQRQALIKRNEGTFHSIHRAML